MVVYADRSDDLHTVHLVYVYVFSIIRTGLREKWIVERHLSFAGFQFTQSLGDGWMDGWMDLARAVAAPAPAPATALYTVHDLTYLVMFLICETKDGQEKRNPCALGTK